MSTRALVALLVLWFALVATTSLLYSSHDHQLLAMFNAWLGGVVSAALLVDLVRRLR